MKAIFCGNLDYDARQSDVERLFRRYGRIDRVDMKSETRAKVSACLSHAGRRKVATADARCNDPFNWPLEALGKMGCTRFLDRCLSWPNRKISRAFGFLKL